jgi:polyisoprenoid-binding protein YceI
MALMSITHDTHDTQDTHDTHDTVLPLSPGRWALDGNHSSVGFTIRHLGVSKVRGRFQDFDVDVIVGPTLDTTSLLATIRTTSIDTGNPDRDAHVRSADLLDVERRPTMVFRSTSITDAGDGWFIDGDLTIGDVTLPQRFALDFGGLEHFPGGPRHAGFEATGELRRTDFGIDLAMPPGVSAIALGDVVKIELDIQLVEPETRAVLADGRSHEPGSI